jgi:hypothetical protein
LIPYSSVGYKIKYDAENDTENSRRFNGTGGLKHFWRWISNKSSVGADANYNFGKNESTSFEYINGVPVGTRE